MDRWARSPLPERHSALQERECRPKRGTLETRPITNVTAVVSLLVLVLVIVIVIVLVIVIVIVLDSIDPQSRERIDCPLRTMPEFARLALASFGEGSGR